MSGRELPGAATSASWVRWFPQKFSTAVMMLPLEARGAYVTLLCYQANGGQIPDNFELLGVCCPGMSPTTWQLVRPFFELEVDPDTGASYLVNRKMEREVERAEALRKEKVESTRRWRDKQKAHRETNVTTTENSACTSKKKNQKKNQNQNQPPPNPPQGKKAGGLDSDTAKRVESWCLEWNQKLESYGKASRLGTTRLALAAGHLELESWELIERAFWDAYSNGVNNPKQQIKNPTAYVLGLIREAGQVGT